MSLARNIIERIEVLQEDSTFAEIGNLPITLIMSLFGVDEAKAADIRKELLAFYMTGKGKETWADDWRTVVQQFAKEKGYKLQGPVEYPKGEQS